MNPYALHYGFTADQLRRFRIDSRRSFKAFQRRKIAMCLPAIIRSLSNMLSRTRASASVASSVIFAAATLATLTQSFA
jgi:hypothetical protein